MQTLSTQFQGESRIRTWDHFWFHKVTSALHQSAVQLAQRNSRRRPEVSTQLGALLFKAFLDEYWEHRVTDFSQEPYPDSASATAAVLGPGGLCTAVHTVSRRDDLAVLPTLELRAPDTRAYTGQDLHVLAGYCPETGYGYLFGWATAAEVGTAELRQDLRYPCRVLTLADLHPMQSLQGYVEQLYAEHQP